MDIHKPKPWHGLREFAKELGTIILGILIALALEQVAEALRDRARAEEARGNIRQEMAQNLGKLQLRADTEPCHLKRLAEVQDLLDRAGRGEALPRPIRLGTPDVWEMNTARFETASAAGRASLLPADEQAVIARVYSHLRVYAEVSAREQAAWAELRALEHATSLDPALRTALVLALQEARFDRFRIALAGGQAIRQAQAIGVRPDPGPSRGFAHRDFCLPLNATDEDARRAAQKAGLQDAGVGGPS